MTFFVQAIVGRNRGSGSISFYLERIGRHHRSGTVGRFRSLHALGRLCARVVFSKRFAVGCCWSASADAACARPHCNPLAWRKRPRWAGGAASGLGRGPVFGTASPSGSSLNPRIEHLPRVGRPWCWERAPTLSLSDCMRILTQEQSTTGRGRSLGPARRCDKTTLHILCNHPRPLRVRVVATATVARQKFIRVR